MENFTDAQSTLIVKVRERQIKGYLFTENRYQYDKEIETSEWMRLLKQEAERLMNQIIADVWGEGLN